MNGWPLLARSRWLVPGPAICVASRDWLDLLSPYKDQLGSASSWPFFFVLGELLPSVRAWCLGRFLSCYIVPVILVGRHRLFATFFHTRLSGESFPSARAISRTWIATEPQHEPM